MLWWLDYEQTISIVDDEIIDELTKASVPNDFIEKVKQMKGTYNSSDEYLAKIRAVFGENPWQYINETLPKNLQLRKKEFRGNMSYRADGYLGNYIVVDPGTKIVAIRMISGESYKRENDNFREFNKMVLSLTTD